MHELSERRLAENELAFRHINTKAKERQKQAVPSDSDNPLLLDCYCECSSRQCHERIQLTAEEYEQIHRDNRRFIALPNHEDKAIEEVISQLAGFNVIQKYADPYVATSKASR